MTLDFINRLTTFQEGFAGIVLFNPDYFLHGFLGRAFFRTTKSLDDAIVRTNLMASGAFMLGDVLSQILVSKEKEQDKRAFLLYKIFMFGAKFSLYAHTAFFHPSDDFNRTTFAALAITCLYNVLWLSAGLFYTSKKRSSSSEYQEKPVELSINVVSSSDDESSSPSYHRSQKLALFLCLVYGIPCAILPSFYPDMGGPKGMIPYLATTGNENDELDAIQRFVIQLRGAHMMGVLVIPYCIWTRAYQINVTSVLNMVLLIPVCMRGILDNSGMFDRKTHVFTLIGHAATLLCVLRLTITTQVVPLPKKTHMMNKDKAATGAKKDD